MARVPVAGLALILAGCGTSEVMQMDAAVPDSGLADVGVEPPPCTLEAVGALTLPVGAGGSVELAGEGWSEAAIHGVPEGWRATVSGQRVEVRAPYAAGPAGALQIRATCDGERTAEVEIALSAEPLQFTRVTPWTPDVTGPLAREYFSIWIDPLLPDRLWVYGGFHYVPRQFTPGRDVWSLDLASEAWTRYPDGPMRALPGATVAAAPDGSVLRYGGLNLGVLAGERDTPFILQEIETGTAGLSFEDVSVEPPQIAGDYQPAFFFHPQSGKFYAVCGLNDRVGAHCEVRAFDPVSKSWTVEPVAGDAPPGRNGHFWAYDGTTDRLVIFSGEGYPPSAGCTNCLHDTWALELSETPLRWTRLAEETAEIGRRNGAYALDPLHHRLLVWGGTSDGRTTRAGLWALDLTPGEETWHEVPAEGGAPVRTSGGAVFDGPRRRILFGFGNGDSGVHADLWALGL